MNANEYMNFVNSEFDAGDIVSIVIINFDSSNVSIRINTVYGVTLYESLTRQ